MPSEAIVTSPFACVTRKDRGDSNASMRLFPPRCSLARRLTLLQLLLLNSMPLLDLLRLLSVALLHLLFLGVVIVSCGGLLMFLVEEKWSIMNRQYQSAKCSIQSWNNSWTIEDEQCQRIGGGYKAVKFRFLLFL